MKKMKWIASLVLALVLMMGIATTASAAGSYTVTVSGGLYNTQTLEFKSDGKTAVTIPNMTPNNDKYYFKGYTLAGRDLPAGTAGHSQAFVPDKDIELVAHYGMKGSMVSYTIHFVEYGTTNIVHDPETYYGNVGDMPVAPYVYVEGYEPQAYNITGTLKAGTNDWTLYYYKIVTPTAAPDEGAGGGGGGGNANANANANARRRYHCESGRQRECGRTAAAAGDHQRGRAHGAFGRTERRRRAFGEPRNRGDSRPEHGGWKERGEHEARHALCRDRRRFRTDDPAGPADSDL